MVIHLYIAFRVGISNSNISQSKFREFFVFSQYKKLISGQHRKKGRNNRGIITCRHKGGGHKRLYRKIDFKRDNEKILGRVVSIEYDPNRNARICLVMYEDGDKRYILHPRGVQINDKILSGKKDIPITPGNVLPLSAE